jgi:hypothetical protein
MKCNIGKTDRFIRFVLGIVIIIVGLYFKSWWGLYTLWIFNLQTRRNSLTVPEATPEIPHPSQLIPPIGINPYFYRGEQMGR